MSDHTQVQMPRRQVFPLEFHDNTPFLIGEHNGQTCRFLFDSGAQDITLNSRYLTSGEGVEGDRITGFTGKVNTKYVELGALNFGDWQFANRNILAMSLEHAEENGAFGVPVHGLLSQYRTVVCWNRHRFYFLER